SFVSVACAPFDDLSLGVGGHASRPTRRPRSRRRAPAVRRPGPVAPSQCRGPPDRRRSIQAIGCTVLTTSIPVTWLSLSSVFVGIHSRLCANTNRLTGPGPPDQRNSIALSRRWLTVETAGGR